MSSDNGILIKKYWPIWYKAFLYNASQGTENEKDMTMLGESEDLLYLLHHILNVFTEESGVEYGYSFVLDAPQPQRCSECGRMGY